MTENGVMERFRSLAGLDVISSRKWNDLVAACTSEISARVLPENDTEENRCLLEEAAAALALYRQRLTLAAREEITSFRAGDLSVEISGGAAKAARELYVQALAACGGLMKENDFIFGRAETLCTET